MLLNHAVNTRSYFGQLGELVCKRDFRSAIPDRRFPIAGTIFMPREGVNGTSQITSHNPQYVFTVGITVWSTDAWNLLPLLTSVKVSKRANRA